MKESRTPEVRTSEINNNATKTRNNGSINSRSENTILGNDAAPDPASSHHTNYSNIIIDTGAIYRYDTNTLFYIFKSTSNKPCIEIDSLIIIDSSRNGNKYERYEISNWDD
jgi:hypothetical protein